ncbi:MAG TPA: chemotaxis protein CheD [Bacteroidales bacterium]|jgi:chemotaxis protein CheD|nr:chemotaxis protein CheD [Bacteroidales bacterium]
MSATHFLYPSTIFASREPVYVNTILGSCVAVCFYDTVLKYGGINHYMLPFWNGQGLASPKYGNIAIQKLFEKMQSFGSSPKNLVAKVFGGGNIIEASTSQFMIGDRNIAVAQELLRDLQIKIVSQSIGGSLGRKIQFNTGSGEVMQKMIEKQNTEALNSALSNMTSDIFNLK